MNPFFPERFFTAWSRYASARKSKTKTRRLAEIWREELLKRRLLAYMLASAQVRLQRQTNARIRVVSNILKRVLRHWKAALICRKLRDGQSRLAKKAKEISVFTTCLNAWKAVVDRNVRLKRMALGIEKTPGLTHFSEPTKGNRLISAISHSIKAVKTQIRDVKTRVWEGMKTNQTQETRVEKGEARSNPDKKETAHFRYLEMQRKFDLIQESIPAPAPDFLPQDPIARAIHIYRVSTMALQSLLHPSNPLSLSRLFSIWKLKSQRKKSLRILSFVHSRKIMKIWVSGIGKYVRNVQGLMREVGVFADLHLKRRSLKQWFEVLQSKFRFGALIRRRKVMKTGFRTIQKYAKERKAAKIGKMKAASHYGWVLIKKTLFSLNKVPIEKRLFSAFRRKSVFSACFQLWMRKLQAHQCFQQLQRRPLKAAKEKSAIWVWWEQCFSTHFRCRHEFLSPIRLRWSGLLRKVVKSWGNYIRKTRKIKGLINSLQAYSIKVGFSQLKAHKNEVIEYEKNAKIAFRLVRLKVSLRLWKKCTKLQILKKSFIEKRFFTAWKSAQKRVLSFFQEFHKVQILKKCWSILQFRTTLQKKAKSAQIWKQKKSDFKGKTGLKIAMIYLLRNVFRRKATRRIESKASRYHLRNRKQALINTWKCHYFAARRKSGLQLKAVSFAKEKETRFPLGPNEGRLLMANVYMGWKVVARRDRNIRAVIEARDRRRGKITISQVLKAWKTASLSKVRTNIEELVNIAKKDFGKHQEILRSAESTALKSDLQAEIEHLEQSIKVTLSGISSQHISLDR